MKICISGIEINYEVHGEGKPIIVLHGWNEDSGVFKSRSYKKLLSGYRVYAIDLPGFGGSGDMEHYSFDALDNVLAGLVDHIGLQRFHLLGQCMGGIIALDFAIRHRERIEELILVETMIYFPLWLNLLLVKHLDGFILRFMLQKKLGARLFGLHRALRHAGRDKKLLKLFGKADISRSLKYIRLMKTYSRYDHIARAGVLKMPVTLIISYNTFKQVEKTSKRLFVVLDSVRLFRLPSRNHFIFG